MVRMSNLEPIPQRLSDADRDAAVDALRTHFEAGRLTSDEFDERMSTALAARTASVVAPLFDDLPEPRPAWLSATQPTWNTYPGASAAPELGSPASGGTYSPPSARLPAPRVDPPTPATPADRWMGAIHGVIWPAAIIWMVFGHGPWWIILVAVVVSSALGGYQGSRSRNNRQPPPY